MANNNISNLTICWCKISGESNYGTKTITLPISINDIYFATKTIISASSNFSSSTNLMWKEFTRLFFANDNVELSQPLTIQKFATSFVFVIGK